MDDGTRVFIDDGRVAAYLGILEEFSETTGMRLNRSKTAALSFTFGQGFISLGGLCFPSGERIQSFEETRLLGVNIDRELSLNSFVNQRKAAAMGALWSIQRLKSQGVTNDHLRFAYLAFVRSVLEYSVPSLFPMLDQYQLSSMESIQKIATRVLTNYGEGNYCQRLETLELTSLETRWADRFRKLALEAEHNPRIMEYLVLNPANHNMETRNRRLYDTPKCTTERFRRSPINQAISIINNFYLNGQMH